MRRVKPLIYPVVVASSNKTASLVTAGVLAVAAALGCGWMLLAALSPGLAWVIGTASAVAAALAVAFWNDAVTVCTIRPEGIEKTGLFGHRELPRSAIVGIRSGEIRSRYWLVAVDGPVLAVSSRVHRLAEDWFVSLRDLDVEDVKAVREVLDSDPRLGANQPARRRTIAQWRRAADKAGWAMTALFFWTLLYPKPYLLVITLVAILPVLALGIHSVARGWLSLNAIKTDPRPQIDQILLMPPLLLMLRALLDFRFLDWHLMVGATAIVAATTAVLLWRAFPALKRGMLSLTSTLLITWAYIYGVAAQLDVQLDVGKPAVYRTNVMALRVNRGSKHTDYEVTVTPWGPERIDESIDVTPAFFGSLKVGEEVCVYQSGGALAIRWYELGRC